MSISCCSHCRIVTAPTSSVLFGKNTASSCLETSDKLAVIAYAAAILQNKEGDSGEAEALQLVQHLKDEGSLSAFGVARQVMGSVSQTSVWSAICSFASALLPACACGTEAGEVKVPKRIYSLDELRLNRIEADKFLAPSDDRLGRIRTACQVMPDLS